VQLVANVGGVTHTIEVDEGDGPGFVRVVVDDREYVVDVATPLPGFYSLLAQEQVFSVVVSLRRGRREVQIGAWTTSVEISPAQGRRPTTRSAASTGGRQEVTAPMSGRIVQVLVQDGQVVQEGESLVIIEAMKMETEIRAVAHGQVKDIQVEAGMAVEEGQLLLVVTGS
jgi:biotin carboxyl carrier protein